MKETIDFNTNKILKYDITKELNVVFIKTLAWTGVLKIVI